MDDEWSCYNLEDCVRSGPKVYGKTAIPVGRYRIVIDLSVRFQRRMPRLLDVAGFSGIRIHNGNTAADTEGCILIGASRKSNFVGYSRQVFAKLMERLEATRDEIWIEIV